MGFLRGVYTGFTGVGVSKGLVEFVSESLLHQLSFYLVFVRVLLGGSWVVISGVVRPQKWVLIVELPYLKPHL